MAAPKARFNSNPTRNSGSVRVTYKNSRNQPVQTEWNTTTPPYPTITSEFEQQQSSRIGIPSRLPRLNTENNSNQFNSNISYNNPSLNAQNPLPPPISTNINTDPRDDSDSDFLTTPSATNDNASSVGLARRAAAQRVFWVIGGIHVWIWFNLQVVLVVMSLVFLAITGFINDTWVGRRVADAGAVAGKVLNTVGINTSLYNPSDLFFLFYLLCISLLWGAMIFTIFAYTVMQFKPLFGRASGLKISMVVVALIGYAIPGANLIPWIFPYIWVMRKYPD